MAITNDRHGNMTSCGHEHIGAFSLVNMNARLYDPWAARFLSPDPYVQLPDFTQSLNRYSYCWNNPLIFLDLTGNDVWLIDKYGNRLLLAQSETEWTVQLPEVEVTPPQIDNGNPDSLTDWTSIVSFTGGAITTRAAELQYSQNFKLWTGLNGQRCIGLSGPGPNQHTGSRIAAKIKANRIKKISRYFVALSLSTRVIDYETAIKNNPNLGPNMKNIY